MHKSILSSISLILLLGTEQVQAVQAVHDAMSLAKMADGLKMAGKSFQALQSVRGELRELSSVLGNEKISALLESKGIDLMGLEDFGSDLEAIGNGDVLDTLNRGNQKYRSGEDHSQLIRMKNYASQKLHGLDERVGTKYGNKFDNPLKLRDDSSLEMYETPRPSLIRTQRDLDNVITTRQNYIIQASSLGQAMASSQKQKWSKKDLKALKKLKRETDTQTTLLGQMTVNSKLLELIASQNNMRNLLLAQILDNLSALTAQTIPVVFKQTATSPSHKSHPKPISGLQKLKGAALKLVGS